MQKVTGTPTTRQPKVEPHLEQAVRSLFARWGYLLRTDRPGRYSIVNPERNNARLDSGLTLAQAAEWINRIEKHYEPDAEHEVTR